MKKILLSILTIFLLESCKSPEIIQNTYREFYNATPISVLILPPINKTHNSNVKDYFQSTLSVSIANLGYYVIPSLCFSEIIKNDSTLYSERLLNSDLLSFKNLFNADVVLFTIIHKWSKGLNSVNVEIEYIIKSTKTNNIIYSRRGEFKHNNTVSTDGGLLLNMALTAANTAIVNSLDVASLTNTYTFNDMPSGKYSPFFKVDGTKPSGEKVFNATLNSNTVHKKNSQNE